MVEQAPETFGYLDRAVQEPGLAPPLSPYNPVQGSQRHHGRTAQSEVGEHVQEVVGRGAELDPPVEAASKEPDMLGIPGLPLYVRGLPPRPDPSPPTPDPP